MTIEVAYDLVVRLRPLAAQRDVPLARFVRDVLDALSEEPGLVGAILDHGAGLGGYFRHLRRIQAVDGVGR